MIFTESSLKVSHRSVDTSRVGIYASKGKHMKHVAAAIITAVTLITAPIASAITTRDLTDMHMQRCRDTVTAPTSTTAQIKYACNPTGTDATGINRTAMQSACRSFWHPEWYESFPGRRPVDPNWRSVDDDFIGSWLLGVAQQLPPVTTETSNASTDCGTKAELDDLRQDQWEARELAKGKPQPWAVWKCTKRTDAQKAACYWDLTQKPVTRWKCTKRKGHKRKCRKINVAPKAPATTQPAQQVDDTPKSEPVNSAALTYASAVWSMISGCSRTSLTYAQVLQRSKSDTFWTSKCSVLYYDKLRALDDAFNAAHPDLAVPYPSLMIVTQIENVYLKRAGTPAEIANLNCWLAWGRNTTSQPIPTGCNG